MVDILYWGTSPSSSNVTFSRRQPERCILREVSEIRRLSPPVIQDSDMVPTPLTSYKSPLHLLLFSWHPLPPDSERCCHTPDRGGRGVCKSNSSTFILLLCRHFNKEQQLLMNPTSIKIWKFRISLSIGLLWSDLIRAVFAVLAHQTKPQCYVLSLWRWGQAETVTTCNMRARGVTVAVTVM